MPDPNLIRDILAVVGVSAPLLPAQLAEPKSPPDRPERTKVSINTLNVYVIAPPKGV